MRQVSFGERVVFAVPGTAFAGALAFGPAGKGGEHVCVVGTSSGQIHVFAGRERAYVAEDLGQVRAQFLLAVTLSLSPLNWVA